jgi:predicted RNase H-like HicB family nuclease
MMQKSRYQAIVYRQAEGPWVAEVPALSGCYAMMPTKEEALEELGRVLRSIAADYQGQGKELPSDTTQIIRV